MDKEYAKSLFGKGYSKLIDKLYNRLKPEQITWIKPKYWRIDLYINWTEEEQDFWFDIERESENTCEVCGKKWELKNESGWITALCNKCFNKRKNV